jgi:5-methylcytosine-specific restriction endonuclease McrA
VHTVCVLLWLGCVTQNDIFKFHTFAWELNEVKPRTHGHRGTFPEQNIKGLCSKIKNQQRGPHIITKFL